MKTTADRIADALAPIMDSDMVIAVKIEGGSFDLIDRLVTGRSFTLVTLMGIERRFSTPSVRIETIKHPEYDLGDGEFEAAYSETLQYRYFDLDESPPADTSSVAEVLYCPLERILILQDDIEVKTAAGTLIEERICGFEYFLASSVRGDRSRGYRMIHKGIADTIVFGDIDDAKWALPDTLRTAKEMKKG